MRRIWPIRLLLLIGDIFLLEAAFYVAYWWRFTTGVFANPVSFRAPELFVPSLFVTIYWISLFAWFGLYRFDPLQSRALAVRDSFKAAAVGVLVLFILTFDPTQPLPSSRVILVLYGIGIFAIVSGNRVGLLTVLQELRIHGIGVLRTLLVGDSHRATVAVRHVAQHPELGLRLRGVLCGRDSKNTHLALSPILGSLSSLRQQLRSGRFDAVLLALDEADEPQLGRLIRVLRESRVRSLIFADQYQLLIGEVKPRHVHGHPLVDIRPELLSGVERVLKRTTDFLLALTILVATVPLWIIIAVAIAIDSPGAVFYSQTRVGLNGQPFTLLKFRSMSQDAESVTGAVLAVEDDPRVTRVGRLIRATHLDELPQLINVLMGKMSLVGPRPERIEFVNRFVKEIPLYERRLNVKPGLTGWSQVHLRYDSYADQISTKLKYDFYYIENMSLPLDLKIMFMTLFVMLRGEGL